MSRFAVRSGHSQERYLGKQDNYVLHVLQLVAEHVPQDALPPMGADTPSPLLEKEAKADSILLLLLRHRGQEASSFA